MTQSTTTGGRTPGQYDGLHLPSSDPTVSAGDRAASATDDADDVETMSSSSSSSSIGCGFRSLKRQKSATSQSGSGLKTADRQHSTEHGDPSPSGASSLAFGGDGKHGVTTTNHDRNRAVKRSRTGSRFAAVFASRQRDNYNHKYVCITTYNKILNPIITLILLYPNPNYKPNHNPNPTTRQRATVNMRLNIVTCSTYPDKFRRDMVLHRLYYFWL